ncbi:hypothetical protein M2281_005049 [Mesorhizobium soli]|uniref:hypothetical protein n=1 Tax=Pseudaminobacter soli (ex Li et al. 2025) TaxID=1295366 RepID=UPI0024751EBB|nr:hypothetical protein [Mesorhizobium soli]MDH6234431.1 hypothetical protein [Mesorhizobium soli]
MAFLAGLSKIMSALLTYLVAVVIFAKLSGANANEMASLDGIPWNIVQSALLPIMAHASSYQPPLRPVPND